MSKKYIFIVFFIGFFQSQVILVYSSDSQEEKAPNKFQNYLAHVKNEFVSELNRLRAAYNEDTKFLKQQSTTFSNELENFSEIVQVILDQNEDLKSRLGQLENENIQLKSDFSTRLKKLELLINEEETIRKDTDREIVEEVSSELNRIVSQINGSSPGSRFHSSVTNPYQIYTVVKGDTLGAIAKAFNTPLKKLMSVNKINDHTIFVGQKLKIPRN